MGNEECICKCACCKDESREKNLGSNEKIGNETLKETTNIDFTDNNINNFQNPMTNPALTKKFSFKDNSEMIEYLDSDKENENNNSQKKSTNKVKIHYSEDTEYEGQVKNGQFNGQGKLKTKDYVYEGTFLHNKKNGQGKIEFFKSKKIYEGSFVNDYIEGYGIELSNNQGMESVFQGYFKKGKKHGKGKFIWNGCEYIGDFANDNFEGEGFFKWNDNKYYEGSWKNNCLNGFGIYTENEQKYIGYFQNDIKNGIGAIYYTNSNIVIISYWANNARKDGFGIVYDNDKKERVVNIKNSILTRNYTDNEIDVFKLKEKEEFKNLQKFYRDKILVLDLSER